MALRPGRHGTAPIRMHDEIPVRLLLHEGAFFLHPFLSSLSRCRGEGEFTCLSLALVEARDAMSGNLLHADGRIVKNTPIQFFEEALHGDMEKLLELREWTMQFSAPLRLTLPSGHPNKTRGDGKYAAPEDLLAPGGLDNLLKRVRFLTPTPLLPLRAEPTHSTLSHENMRYNATRQMALGGIVGTVRWQARPNFDQARAIVLGQYFGAGKNPLFGLGFWHIPELAP